MTVNIFICVFCWLIDRFRKVVAMVRRAAKCMEEWDNYQHRTMEEEKNYKKTKTNSTYDELSLVVGPNSYDQIRGGEWYQQKATEYQTSNCTPPLLFDADPESAYDENSYGKSWQVQYFGYNKNWVFLRFPIFPHVFWFYSLEWSVQLLPVYYILDKSWNKL